MVDNLQERYDSYKDNIQLFTLAKKLISKYGHTNNIPFGEMKQSITGFEEAELLACCQLAEEKAKVTVTIH